MQISTHLSISIFLSLHSINYLSVLRISILHRTMFLHCLTDNGWCVSSKAILPHHVVVSLSCWGLWQRFCFNGYIKNFYLEMTNHLSFPCTLYYRPVWDKDHLMCSDLKIFIKEHYLIYMIQTLWENFDRSTYWQPAIPSWHCFLELHQQEEMAIRKQPIEKRSYTESYSKILRVFWNWIIWCIPSWKGCVQYGF